MRSRWILLLLVISALPLVVLAQAALPPTLVRNSGSIEAASLNADTDYLPRAVIAQAQSSDYAFKAIHSGAKWKFGTFPSTGDECYASAPDDLVKCGNFDFGQVNADSINTRAFGDGRLLRITGAGGVVVDGYDGTLGPCTSARARAGRWDPNAGGTSGTADRWCTCRSDGAGNYAWSCS